MATLSRLIEVLLKMEKESPDKRKVYVLTEDPTIYQILKVREDHDRIFLDVVEKE